MPKRIQPLSDAALKSAKPGEKDISLFDGGGMYLLVGRQKFDVNGKPLPASKLWRFKYRFGGKEKLLSFGAYPTISLADARQRREDAKKLLANGVDPGEIKKAQKAAHQDAGENSFEVVAREWHCKFAPTWSDSHAYWVLRRLEQYVFPDIGTRPIVELKAADVLKVLRRIESVALETAHRVKFLLGQIFRYAVGTSRAERDPTADLKGILPPAVRSIMHPLPIRKRLQGF